MLNKVITNLHPARAGEAAALWLKAQTIYPTTKPLWVLWKDNLADIESYIRKAAEDGRCFALFCGEKLSAFLCAEILSFHGEISMMTHYCGHTAESSAAAYPGLYAAACEYGVAHKASAHYVSFDANNRAAQKAFAPYGFGQYSVDAFSRFTAVPESACPYEITLAEAGDAAELLALYEESRAHFLSPPVMLRLPEIAPEQIHALVAEGAVFTARSNGRIVAMADIAVAKANNICRLYTAGCASVCGGLGLYICPEHRRKGLGRAFIGKFAEFSIDRGIEYAHVPWETFNPAANAFWRKYFLPAVVSMKRTVHPDVIM